MSKPAIGESDLDLPKGVMDSLIERFGASTDRVSGAIQEAAEMVNQYTFRYLLPAATWRRLVRAIARYRLFDIPGQPRPDEIKDEYIKVVKELEGIRDGEFRSVFPTNPDAAAQPTTLISWGSQTIVPNFYQ